MSFFQFANDFNNRIGQGFQIVSGDREGGRQVNEIADGPDKDAFLDEARAQAIKVVDAVEFETLFTDLPPKSQDRGHGFGTVVGPGQPIPEPNPQPA